MAGKVSQWEREAADRTVSQVRKQRKRDED